MKDIDEVFLPKVRTNATGVSDPVALDAIRDALDEFCRSTRLWRYEDEFTIAAAQGEALAPPYGAQVLDIERVNFNGRKLDPASTQWLDEHMESWRDLTATECARYFTQTEPNTIRLVPLAAGTVKVWMTLTIGQDAEQVPDFIADQYREAIAHGALARLMMLPGKAYSNPNLAAVKAARFAEILDGLKTATIKGQQRAPVRTRPSFF